MEIFTLLHVLSDIDQDIEALSIAKTEAETLGANLDPYNHKIDILMRVRAKVEADLERENREYSKYLFSRGEG